MERLTKNTIGCFEYDLKEHKHKAGEFNTYDAFFNYSMAIKQLGKYEDANEPKPIEEWHEDDGDCLWWKFPIEEAPYCGNPLDVNFPDYVTHFTRLVLPIGQSED
ncbi:MAG: hypothetical protein LKH93_06825 [Clostridium beijerinckii]|jgi:hypothetical protein|nr:hypothetical protein [Clostridium beijerinckii]MCI1578597.1 hypothetical protein [Clostridium beijerinckii]MCI1582071.1 hypothetical protein [Clostridium beijerinckii]MCI1621921.1 hypothetical protein [Clostridium beijerinckii]